MKNFICLFIITLSLFQLKSEAQHFRDRENLLQGAIILAHQYFKDLETGKAKTLCTFVLNLDPENKDTLSLAKAIREGREITLEHRLLDNGLKYSKYLLAVIKRLPDHPETQKKKSLLAHIVRTITPNEEEVLPYLNSTKFKNYTFEHFPPENHYSELETVDALKTITFSVDYRLPALLPAIDRLNKNLHQANVKVYIDSSNIESESYVNTAGILSHKGPPVYSSARNIEFENISAWEFSSSSLTLWLSAAKYTHLKERLSLPTALREKTTSRSFSKKPKNSKLKF